MILDGQVLGRPLISYKDTKTAIEALTGVVAGMTAYATDTSLTGYYTGASWVWLSPTSGSYVPIVHDITGAYHSTSGRTSGQVIQATGASTFGWSTYPLVIGAASSISGTALVGTPGTLTVSTTNVATDPHTHAITSSSNPGAAARLLASDASGFLQLDGMGVGIAPTAYNPVNYKLDTSDAANGVYGFQNYVISRGSRGSIPTYGFYNILRLVGNTNYAYTRGFESTLWAYNATTHGNLCGQISAVQVGGGGSAGTTTATQVFANRNELTITGGATAGSVSGNAYAGWFGFNSTSAGSVTNYYGLYVSAKPAAQTISGAAYGLYIEAQTATTLAYSIHSLGGLMYHAGNVGIGNSGTAFSAASPIHAINSSATTNAPVEIARFEARVDSTGVGAVGFGPQISLYAESATNTSYRLMSEKSAIYTVATDASRTVLLRESTIGNAVTTGYHGKWSHNAVSNTAIVIVPDGTGDCASVGTFTFAVKDNTSGTTNGGVVVLNPSGGAISLISDGTDTLQITCAASGEVSVARSAGSHTFTVAISGSWF